MKALGRWLLFLVTFTCVGLPALILGAVLEYAAVHFEAGRLYVRGKQTAGPRAGMYRS